MALSIKFISSIESSQEEYLLMYLMRFLCISGWLIVISANANLKQLCRASSPKQFAVIMNSICKSPLALE